MNDDDDDRDLFERAMESMSPGDVYRGKYGDPAESSDEDDADASAPDPTERATREELRRLREERTMKDAFADIDPIERGKYYQRPPSADADELDQAAAEFEAAMAGTPKSSPEPPPPTRPPLAEEAGDCPSLNLRGMDPDEALPKLGLFVDLSSKDGEEFVELKLGSNPDLVKAVQEWFRGDGSVYALEFETEQAHADATVFARIRRQQHS